MRLTRAELTLDADDRLIEFVNDGSVTIGEEKVPVLLLEVEGFEEAQELLSIIDRSRARKMKQKVPDPAPAAGPHPPEDGGGARGKGNDSQREPEPGDQVAGVDGSRKSGGPAGEPEKDRGRVASPSAGSAVPGAGATAAPAAAKRLDCGGERCKAESGTEKHDVSTCPRFSRRSPPKEGKEHARQIREELERKGAA